MITITFILFFTCVASKALPYSDEARETHSALADVIRSELVNRLNDDSGTTGPEHKIIGGWSATTGMIPYQAFISVYGLSGVSSCGGSLISRRHILTAAHCLHRMAGAIIALGSSNRNEYFGPGVVTLVVQGSNFIVHPDYDDLTLKNDIAVIRLTNQVPISFTINTILLPSVEQTATNYFAGKEGLISGFGKTSDDYYDDGSDKLQMAYANITTLEDCQAFWRRSYSIDKTQICTRFQGTGTCQGDSGGPLAVNISNKLTLVGITSFGSVRCEKVAPSVYTNVPSYLDWIRQVIKMK